MRSPSALHLLLGTSLLAAIACGGIAVIDPVGGGGAATGATQSGAGGNGGDAPTSSSSGITISCDGCQALSAAGQLENSEINEASGLAASRTATDRYYVHNDSGDTPRVFVIDELGKQQALISLPEATAIDWEDIAVGRCPDDTPAFCVYVGDIGDNPETRSNYQLYVFQEPDSLNGDLTISPTRYDFVYPDGSHNAETLLVDSQGEPVIVTKVNGGPSGIYRLPKLELGALNEATAAGDVSPPLGLPMITAGDVNPDNGGVLLRTYSNLFYYPPVAGDLVATLGGAPCPMPAIAEGQGEAVAWRADGTGFFTVSEGAGSSIYRYACSADAGP